jgi:hypothetical protein
VTTVSQAYFASQPGWQCISLAGLPAGRSGNQVEILSHPLWQRDTSNPANCFPPLSGAHAAAAAAGATNIAVRSIFDVLRRPYA